MRFAVSPAVMIPRPETEQLVEVGIGWLKANPTRRFAADIGTGSGCISAALAAVIPDLRLIAVDCSSQALMLASANARRHAVDDRITFVLGDLFPASSEYPCQPSFDLVCANLPYIPTAALEGLPVARREPLLALDGGWDGLDLIRRFLALAPLKVAPAGLILLEIESGQAAQVELLARSNFPLAKISVLQDLAGNDRVVKIQMN